MAKKAKKATKKRAKKRTTGERDKFYAAYPTDMDDEDMEVEAPSHTPSMPAFMLICAPEDQFSAQNKCGVNWTGYALEATTLQEAQAEAKSRLLGEESEGEIDWECGEFYWTYGDIGGSLGAGNGLADDVGPAYIVPVGGALPLQEWAERATAWETRMQGEFESMSEDEVEEAKEAYELKAAKEKFERLSAKMEAKTDPSVSRGRRAA